MRWFAKMIFDGGGKDLKNKRKSSGYSNNIFKKFTNFKKKLTFARYDKIEGGALCAQESPGANHFEKYFLTTVCKKIKKQKGLDADYFGKCVLTTVCEKIKKIITLNSKGVILIEFAVCMPILIILLFYINDLVRIKRYHSQTEFMGQQMANIIQNLSQKRDDRKITINDLKRALCLTNLSVYPGTSMFTEDKDYFGHITWVQMYRVVGANNGKAKCTDRIELSTWHGSGATPTEIWFSRAQNDHAGSKVRYSSSAVEPSQIYPSLKIGLGNNSTEEKIILEMCLLTVTNLRPEGKTTDKQILGFQLLDPPCSNYKDKYRFFFQSSIIFTPKLGLFDASGPSEE